MKRREFIRRGRVAACGGRTTDESLARWLFVAGISPR
jgi:hypothetical protein